MLEFTFFFKSFFQNIFTSDYIYRKVYLTGGTDIDLFHVILHRCFHLYTQHRRLYNSPVLTPNIVTICMGTHVSHRVHVARVAIHICVYTGCTTWHILIRAVANVTRVYYSATVQTPCEALKSSRISTPYTHSNFISNKYKLDITLPRHTFRIFQKVALVLNTVFSPPYTFKVNYLKLTALILIFTGRRHACLMSRFTDVSTANVSPILLSELSTRAVSRRKTSSSTDPSYIVTRYNLQSLFSEQCLILASAFQPTSER